MKNENQLMALRDSRKMQREEVEEKKRGRWDKTMENVWCKSAKNNNREGVISFFSLIISIVLKYSAKSVLFIVRTNYFIIDSNN